MDFSERTTLPNCPDCGTPVGELHKPCCDVERCPACGQQKLFCGCDSGHTVWTGEWPEPLQAATQTGVIGYGVMLVFSPAHGHLSGERHRRHDELVAEIVTKLGSDRCTLDSVQADDAVVRYIFFAEPGEAPTEDHLDGLGEKYGPFMAWITTHFESKEDDSTVGWFIGKGNRLELTPWREQALAADALKQSSGGFDKWVGRLVKIGFYTDDEQVTKEWMWVRVDSVQSGKLIGVLDNHPAFADLKFDDTVSFTEDDIAALYVDESDQAEGVERITARTPQAAARLGR